MCFGKARCGAFDHLSFYSVIDSRQFTAGMGPYPAAAAGDVDGAHESVRIERSDIGSCTDEATRHRVATTRRIGVPDE